MQFKNYNRKNIDLIQHCLEQKSIRPDLKVFIGTDSISKNGKIHYFGVVAFRYGRNGAHFVYCREIISINDKTRGKLGVFHKLQYEIELTMKIADSLVFQHIFAPEDITVEFDFNNVINELYQGLIPTARGLAVWQGYNMSVKFEDYSKYGKSVPKELIAVKAADHLCQML